MSEDLHNGCTPMTEARGLFRLLSTGHSVEGLRALIAVPPKLECVLKAYAQENPCEAYWIESCIKFRIAVAREFERLVAASAPVMDLPEESLEEQSSLVSSKHEQATLACLETYR